MACMGRALLVSLTLAGLSLLVVDPAPAYDPWAWLLWGGQLSAGTLNTLDGPSFKPLPVAVATLLAPLGPASVWLWAAVARAGAALAVVLAYRAGHRLAQGSMVAGILAALGVALCGGYLELAVSGMSEGILLALALAGAEAWRSGHPRWALACGVAAGLVRVETWPFLLSAGVVAWRRRPQDRPFLGAVAVLVPLAWTLPELVGSGQALRSATRALVPNPGQPGLSDFPALTSLRAALTLALWPIWVGLALASWRGWRRRDEVAQRLLVPAAVGLIWIGIVAAMAHVGFSGEPRYAVPGVALVAVSGATGLVVTGRRVSSGGVRAPGVAIGMAILLVVTAAVPRIGDAAALADVQAYQWRLQGDLAKVVVDVGGTGAILACGRPFVGPLRGPLLARHLGVPRHRVEPDEAPEAPGVVFRSALHAGEAPAPDIPVGFRPVAQVGLWQVLADCRSDDRAAPSDDAAFWSSPWPLDIGVTTKPG
jgi:hypothetical protein